MCLCMKLDLPHNPFSRSWAGRWGAARCRHLPDGWFVRCGVAKRDIADFLFEIEQYISGFEIENEAWFRDRASWVDVAVHS